MFTRSAAFVALLVAFSGSIALDAQPAEVLFERYLQAVLEYQRNDINSSPVFAALAKSDFNRIRPLLQRRDPRVLEAASLLHTEVAIMAAQPETADLQLAFAEAVLKMLPKDFDEGVPFRMRWYRVVPTIYLARRDPETGRPFIDNGVHAFAADAHLRLLSGIAHEMTAQLHEIICAIDCNSRQRRLDLLKWTGFAASDYREALRLDGDLDEAQLRLGRVTAVAGNATDARVALERIMSGAHDRRRRYLAALFLARVAADRGELPEARGHYRSALALCVDCQSAVVGISLMDALAGSPTGEPSTIERLFQAGRRTERAPWIEYLFPQLDTDTLNALRAEARR